MSEAVIYLGPSLPLDAARKILPEADYRPPICRGDIAYEPSSPRLIGIVDGELAPAISPKEVLMALSRGVTVLGASGVGALRAAELYPYGMIGVGVIFKWYKTSYLQNDDAVGVAYDPVAYRRLSEPLVNVVHALSQASRSGIIRPEEKQKLIRIAKGIHYPDRTYDRLFGEVFDMIPEERLGRLRHYVSSHDFDLQRRDAIQLLRLVPHYLHNPPDLSNVLPIHGIEFKRLRRLPGLHEGE